MTLTLFDVSINESSSTNGSERPAVAVRPSTTVRRGLSGTGWGNEDVLGRGSEAWPATATPAGTTPARYSLFSALGEGLLMSRCVGDMSRDVSQSRRPGWFAGWKRARAPTSPARRDAAMPYDNNDTSGVTTDVDRQRRNWVRTVAASAASRSPRRARSPSSSREWTAIPPDGLDGDGKDPTFAPTERRWWARGGAVKRGGHQVEVVHVEYVVNGRDIRHRPSVSDPPSVDVDYTPDATSHNAQTAKRCERG